MYTFGRQGNAHPLKDERSPVSGTTCGGSTDNQ